MQEIIATINDKRYSFGGGRYSAATAELARDLYRITDHEAGVCVSIAKAAAADFGRYQGQSAMAVGKANKDGQVTLKDMGSKVKGVTLTNALAVLRAVSLINSLEYVKYPMPKLEFIESIEKWIVEKLTPTLSDEEQVAAEAGVPAEAK